MPPLSIPENILVLNASAILGQILIATIKVSAKHQLNFRFFKMVKMIIGAKIINANLKGEKARNPREKVNSLGVKAKINSNFR